MNRQATEAEAVRTYRAFAGGEKALRKVRRVARDAALFFLSLGRSIATGTSWIGFPYYHHVFDDERDGFRTQLEYLSRFGDFVTLDEAISIISEEKPVPGRHFCLTFDDGYKNCITNAAPILDEMGIRATIYVATDLVGRTEPVSLPGDEIGRLPDRFIEYLSWDDCRALTRSGHGIESHSKTHRRISELSAADALGEMRDSKKVIASEVGRESVHFCCPFGKPGRDFSDRDLDLAREVGYRSFATGARGRMRHGDSPYFIRRDHLLANWGVHQIRYFMSRG